MNKIMAFFQLLTWLLAASYFGLMTFEKIKLIKPTHNEIITQLEQQVNYELE